MPVEPWDPGFGEDDDHLDADGSNSDADHDDASLRLPGPPVDRVWRHPSELREISAAGASPPPIGSPTANQGAFPFVGRRPRASSVVTLALGFVVAGALVAALLGFDRSATDDAGLFALVAAPPTSLPVALIPNATPVVTAAPSSWLGIDGWSDRRSGRQVVVLSAVTEGAPADTAGMAVGDCVVAIDGTEVTTMGEVRLVLARSRPGATVAVDLLRDGQLRTVNVIVTARPSA